MVSFQRVAIGTRGSGSEYPESRIVALLTRAADEFGDVSIRVGTVGETAKRQLDEIRRLGLGKEAPEITGKDQDGREFRLGDYRGKVVLLYFWSEYCLTCRTLWPHERELVKRLEKRPFVMLGVNSWTHEAGELAQVLKREDLPWRTFDDRSGEINRQWNFPATPAVYLIDHRGVIRRKWVGKPGEKSLDAAVLRILDEAERERR